MKYIKLFLFGGWSDKYRAHLRPFWQIAFLFMIWPLYWSANKFVTFMDKL